MPKSSTSTLCAARFLSLRVRFGLVLVAGVLVLDCIVSFCRSLSISAFLLTLPRLLEI